MINTKMIISGESAIEFHNLMHTIDRDAIEARTEFLSDVNVSYDDGIISVGSTNIDFDLSALDEDESDKTFEVVPFLKEECYVNQVHLIYNPLNISNKYTYKAINVEYGTKQIYKKSRQPKYNNCNSMSFSA